MTEEQTEGTGSLEGEGKQAQESSAAKPSEEQKVESVDLPVFFGVKAGMTRLFNKSGNHVPVTVVKLIPNYISQVKTVDKEGYNAYQIGHFTKREKCLSAPVKGHLKSAKIKDSLARFAEIRVKDVDAALLGKKVGQGEFKEDSFVDVTGVSKGKGFQGVMKRWNFSGGPAAHGSKFHRAPGSVGMCADPARLFKKRKMPGHMGTEKKTVQNLTVVEVNVKEGFMLIKGSVPGPKNGVLKIAKAKKK